jgi:hypothetical protein
MPTARRVAQAVARLLVDVEDDAAASVQEEGIGRVVHEDAEAALACPQLVLGAAELRDVLDGPEHAARPARFGLDGVPWLWTTRLLAVRPPHTVFDVVARASVEGGGQRRRRRAHDRRGAPATPLGLPSGEVARVIGPESEDAQQLWRHGHVTVGDVALPVADVRHALRFGEPALALPQAAQDGAARQTVGEAPADLLQQALLLRCPRPRP